MLRREPRPRAAVPGHHLVGDEQNAVPSADLGDSRPVVIWGDRRPERSSGDRFGQEARHGLRALTGDRVVELLGVPPTAAARVVRIGTPVLVGGPDVDGTPEPRFIRPPKRLTAG